MSHCLQWLATWSAVNIEDLQEQTDSTSVWRWCMAVHLQLVWIFTVLVTLLFSSSRLSTPAAVSELWHWHQRIFIYQFSNFYIDYVYWNFCTNMFIFLGDIEENKGIVFLLEQRVSVHCVQRKRDQNVFCNSSYKTQAMLTKLGTPFTESICCKMI